MMKKRFWGLSILLVAVLILSVLALGGCDTEDPPDDDDNGVPDTPDPDPDPDPEFKTLTIAMTGIPQTMDPSDWRGADTGIFMQRTIFEPIMMTNHDGLFIPVVAESITQIDDLNYEIKLRKGITFHNGDPLTADDMIFFIERTLFEGGMEGETAAQFGVSGPVESVEKVDDHTLILKLESPFYMGRRWGIYIPIPKNYFEEVGPDGFREHPIGVGPFKWVEGDLAEYVVLERYEDYWGGPDYRGDVDRVPAVDRLIFRFIREPTTRVAALMAGDVDIIQGVDPDSVQLLANHPDIDVVGTAGTRIAALWFNPNKAPFDDKRVRQAVAYAIDLDLIIEQQLLGFAEPFRGRPFILPFPDSPEAGYYEHLESPYNYDLEKARALLEEAGVNGSPIIIDSVPEFSEIAQVIGQMLGDIGFEASVRIWERAMIHEAFRQGERDLLLSFWGRASRDPRWIEIVATTGDRGNHGNYSNPELDDILRTALGMDPFDPARYELYIKGFELAMEELPVFSLFTNDVIEAHRSNVKNFYPDYTGTLILHKVDIE